MTWLRKLMFDTATPNPFGPLEWRVLEAVWGSDADVSVRDLQPQFPDIAYTTLMTTLDRLHRKDVLRRVKHGRAFRYTARLTRAELESSLAAGAVRAAIKGDEAALRPLMSYFVDAVGEHDRDMLDELEALVRTRRAALEKQAR